LWRRIRQSAEIGAPRIAKFKGKDDALRLSRACRRESTPSAREFRPAEAVVATVPMRKATRRHVDAGNGKRMFTRRRRDGGEGFLPTKFVHKESADRA